jgi:tripartite-type tricarboxylate transporter receptor subunit TctC
MADSAIRQKISERTREAMADPAVRQKMKTAWADPLARARHSAATKLGMAKPEVRQRISERTKTAMADPKVRQRIKDGRLQAAEERDGEMTCLCDAWQNASPTVRRAFIAEVMVHFLADVS